MTTPDHIINREVFEFTYSETGQAFALRGQMNGGLQYKMQAVINDVLDECNVENVTVRLNRLEIDLGEIPFGSLNTVLPEKLYRTFRKEMLNVIKENNNYLAEITFDQSGENISDHLKLLEIFLLTGCLPWWSGAIKDFSLTAVINYLIENAPAELKSVLFRNITNHQFSDRLVYQLDIETCERLITLLPVSKDYISSVGNIINTLSLKVSRDYSSEAITTQKVLPEEHSVFSVIDFKKNVLRVMLRLMAQPVSSFGEDEIEFLLKTAILEVFKVYIEPGKIAEVLKASEAINSYSENVLLKAGINAAREAIKETHLKKNEIVEAKIEKRFIQNAGLVLIATFLPSIFNELHWLDNGHFVKKESQYRALFLLHYMCTGQDEAPEYTLQLNKILCGLDLEEPIPFSVGLTEIEKNEANLLLHDILTHWSALKNSSVEGLQGSFLLRDGLLSFTNEHWLLQVERKGYDVLIDHLPWSWKTIKFDWMNNLIDTEW